MRMLHVIANQEFVLVELHRRSKWMLLVHRLEPTPVKKGDSSGSCSLPPSWYILTLQNERKPPLCTVDLFLAECREIFIFFTNRDEM